MNCAKTLSVVIGFKDWGINRLKLTLSELVPQVKRIGGEVIVSDYGSKDATAVEDLASSSGARYVYTETDGTWSRSRALNAGFAISEGSVLIATDADMLFAPGTLAEIYSCASSDRTGFYLLQCRDLPPEFTAERIAASDIDWWNLDSVSRYRPRYGMGGMIAFPREAFLILRGFDERMETYGGEDIDFAQRLQRYGLSLNWISSDIARMFHVWHPSSRAISEQSTKGRASVNYNSDILQSDKSYIRNLDRWRHRPNDARPVASIVICTRNRVEYLKESVYSSLSQSVADIEVIVVDDGSSDGTLEFLNSIEDDRLRVFQRPAIGIAAARNFAAAQTEAAHTVIFDDDDIMLPNRVRDHFTSLQGGDNGTYGAWIDFSEDGSLVKLNPGRQFSHDIVHVIGGVYLHPTLMIETRLIREFGYDETFRSGSDFNLATRLVLSGVALRHTLSAAILRRVHANQITNTDGDYQRSSWATTRALSMLSVSKPQFDYIKRREDSEIPDVGLDSSGARFLVEKFGPASLSRRTMSFTDAGSIAPSFDVDRTSVNWSVTRPDGNVLSSSMTINNPDWKTIYEFQISSGELAELHHMDGSHSVSSPSYDMQDVLMKTAVDYLQFNDVAPTRFVNVVAVESPQVNNKYNLLYRGKNYVMETWGSDFIDQSETLVKFGPKVARAMYFKVAD